MRRLLKSLTATFGSPFCVCIAAAAGSLLVSTLVATTSNLVADEPPNHLYGVELPAAEGLKVTPKTLSLATATMPLVMTVNVPEGWDVDSLGNTVLVTPASGAETDLGCLFVGLETAVDATESVRAIAQTLVHGFGSSITAEELATNVRPDPASGIAKFSFTLAHGEDAHFWGRQTNLGSGSVLAICGGQRKIANAFESDFGAILGSITEPPPTP